MRFADIIGQEEVKAFFVRQHAEQRLPHAQLLVGHPGGGAFLLALAYAQYLGCEQRRDGDSCGECPCCRAMQAFTHPDLHLCLPEAGVRSGVDPMDVYVEQLQVLRSLMVENPYFTEQEWYSALGATGKQGIISAATSGRIIETLFYKSRMLPFKFMVLWLPERMHVVAANKLLKVLEEPSRGTVFLLVTEHEELILPTVYSRLQRVTVPPIALPAMREALVGRLGCEEQQADQVAHWAGGDFSRAQALVNQSFSPEVLSAFQELMRAAYSTDVERLLGWVDEAAALDREQLKATVRYYAQLLRAAFMMNIGLPELGYCRPEEAQFLNNFCPYTNGRNVGRLLYECSNLLEHLYRNGHQKILLTDFAFRLSRLLGPGLR